MISGGFKPNTTSGFTFGSTITTTTTAGQLGATKPLFGSAPTNPTSLFGSNPVTSTATPLFGSTQTTSSAPLFGSLGQTTGGLFGAKTTAPTTTTFSFAPKPGGLFSSTATAQPQTTVVPTLQDIVQKSEFLVRSLTNVEIYGDERDNLISKLNQILAACGIGSGYYRSDIAPFEYKPDGFFYRFKALGYNRLSSYKDSDGIISLNVPVAAEQLNAATRQKMIDALNVVLGNNVNVRAHLELVKPLPGNLTEVLFYVIEKGRGRVPSKEVYNYLKQPAQSAQLKNAMNITEFFPRISHDEAAIKHYLENPPTGIDPQIWEQGIKDNPDPDRLVPYPIRSVEQLLTRQKLQASELAVQEKALEALKIRVHNMNVAMADGEIKLAVCRYELLYLEPRFLIQRFSMNINEQEEKLETRLESINMSLCASGQIKESLMELGIILKDNWDTLKNSNVTNKSLSDSLMSVVARIFFRNQSELEKLLPIVKSREKDLSILEKTLL